MILLPVYLSSLTLSHSLLLLLYAIVIGHFILQGLAVFPIWGPYKCHSLCFPTLCLVSSLSSFSSHCNTSFRKDSSNTLNSWGFHSKNFPWHSLLFLFKNLSQILFKILSKFSINVYTHHKNRIIYIYYQVNTVKELVRYNYDSFTYKERDSNFKITQVLVNGSDLNATLSDFKAHSLN